jgi:hypothetical protein
MLAISAPMSLTMLPSFGKIVMIPDRCLVFSLMLSGGFVDQIFTQ